MTLIIIRGLPGSGKSTLAHKLSPHVFEADDYFYTINDNGDMRYVFNKEMVPQAHEYCFNRAEAAMRNKLSPICVSNTFTRFWEYSKYLDLAQEHSYDVQIIHCTGTWDNVHGCPPETIELMRRRMEPSFLSSDDYERWLLHQMPAKLSISDLTPPVF